MKTKRIKKDIGEPVIENQLYYMYYDTNKICVIKANGIHGKRTFQGTCIIDQSKFKQTGDFCKNWDRESFTLL